MIPNISKSRVLGSLQVVLEKMQGCWFKDVCLRGFAVQLESGSYVQNFAVSTSEREITKDPHKQVIYQRSLNLEGVASVSICKTSTRARTYQQTNMTGVTNVKIPAILQVPLYQSKKFCDCMMSKTWCKAEGHSCANRQPPTFFKKRRVTK